MLEHPRTNLGQNVQLPEMQLNCASFRNDPPQPSRKQWRPFAARAQTAQTRFRTVNLSSLSERSVLTQFNNISEMFSTTWRASLERAHSQEYSYIYLYMSVSSLFCKKWALVCWMGSNYRNKISLREDLATFRDVLRNHIAMEWKKISSSF